ncbi:MAG: tetratricopeptide repeat protein [Saprospiraceae bacterium]|nr:tetratricopeptide repeat protein [Saprospiraceae bacterium]
MAKVIPYRSDRNRKLGFKKVRSLKGSAGQLNLFDRHTSSQRSLSNTTGSHFYRALELDGKDDQLAAHHYEQAISHDDHTVDAFCNMGIVYARMGSTSKAIDCFTRCLSLESRHVEAHYNLANMYYDVQNYLLAAAHYEIALTIQPDLVDALFNLALTYIDLARYTDAESHLERYLLYCGEEEKRAAEKLLLFVSLKRKL